MKKLILLSLILAVFAGCKNNDKKNAENSQEFESFIVQETMDAGGYTYILGESNGVSNWYAITAREVKVGDEFFFANPMVMTDFYSQELERPFDEITFLMEVSKDPSDLVKTEVEMGGMPSGKILTDQLELSIELPKEAISIAELYENKQNYAGKTVIVKGQVTKFSPEIMNTNWIHIQDGTSFDGKYDLTLTGDIVVAVGEVMTFEGVVANDKDFGYGYVYEVLLEGSIVK